MVRILFVVNNLIVGGVEKVCWEYASHLSERYQIDFLVAINENDVQFYECKVKEIGCRVYKAGRIVDSKSRKNFLNLEKTLIKRNKYDVVHSHMDFFNIWTLKAAKQVGVKKRISHVHICYPEKNTWTLNVRLKYYLQKRLINYYSTIRLGCSWEAINDHYGAERGTVIYNAFDLEDFTLEKKNYLNKQLITVGRICEQKNPLFIVDLISELVKIDPAYKLIWIGAGHMENEVKSRIAKLQLDSYIEMCGCTTDILPWYSKATYAVYPSVQEGLGISVVEAQAAGCVCFCSDAIPKEADLGTSVFISLECSPREWAKYIDLYIEKLQAKGLKMDTEKLKRYDINVIIKQIETIYMG